MVKLAGGMSESIQRTKHMQIKNEKKMATARTTRPIKFIEFYSGIGGWSHALKKVLGEGKATAVGAYDHSTIW